MLLTLSSTIAAFKRKRLIVLGVQLTSQLNRIMLDAYSRRHEAQKIYERQGAAQNWISWRDNVLQGQRPQPRHASQLAACDRQLRVVSSLSSSSSSTATNSDPFLHPIGTNTALQELAALTDEVIYSDLRSSDCQMGRWTTEDPSLRAVQRWLRNRH